MSSDDEPSVPADDGRGDTWDPEGLAVAALVEVVAAFGPEALADDRESRQPAERPAGDRHASKGATTPC